MLEQTSNRFQTVFALGDHGSSHLSFPSLVFDLTYFAIKQRKNENDEILMLMKVSRLLNVQYAIIEISTTELIKISLNVQNVDSGIKIMIL